MDDNDRRGPWSQRRVDRGGVEAVRRRVYVRERGQRTRKRHGPRDLHVAEGRYDDLVTGSYAGRPEQCSSSHAGDARRAT
ncbi:hypothetical protein GCM10010469_29430 [Streptomyces labedae]|uniref:Uncharacterized protein n=1 Tax=Streptomyces labedae TaxID=285569 RepID=A0ABP6QWG8_9ACTN